MGLIQSDKKEGYAYRVYSPENVLRLQQIVILRKLRIPIKEISNILQSEDATEIIETFQKNLSEVDEEITALSTIRDIIQSFISHLNESMERKIKPSLLDDSDLLEAVDLLSVQKVPVKNEKTMEDLEKAEEKLMELTDKEVRIIYQPAMTVAAIYVEGQAENGDHAEVTTNNLLKEFVKKTNLKEVYPAARCMGFNKPDGVPDDDPKHGYERWISIPDSMEVPAPFVKKLLEGGLYAVHMINDGDWDNGWMPLHSYVNESKSIDFRWGTVDGVCGWLEEELNFWDWDKENGKNRQYDLLMPVQRISETD